MLFLSGLRGLDSLISRLVLAVTKYFLVKIIYEIEWVILIVTWQLLLSLRFRAHQLTMLFIWTLLLEVVLVLIFDKFEVGLQEGVPWRLAICKKLNSFQESHKLLITAVLLDRATWNDRLCSLVVVNCLLFDESRLLNRLFKVALQARGRPLLLKVEFHARVRLYRLSWALWGVMVGIRLERCLVTCSRLRHTTHHHELLWSGRLVEILLDTRVEATVTAA